MLTGIKSILFYCSLALALIGNAQSPIDDLSLNRSALKYYSGVELNDMSTSNPQHYNQLKYYLTSSFSVSVIDCNSCEVDYNELFNYDMFNIKAWEGQRLENNPNTITYREKYNIVLHSQTEVEQVLNQPINSIFYKEYRPLPKYVDSGNSSVDYANYKLAMRSWITDFPEKYRVLTSERNIHSIRISDYLELTQERKDYLNARDNFYLLID